MLIYLIAQAGSGKRAFMIGWLFGVGHFTFSNQWIAVAFTFQAAMPIWLGYVAVVALALYLAVYPALAAWGAWWVARIIAPHRLGDVATDASGMPSSGDTHDITDRSTAGQAVPLPVPGRY